MKRNKKKAAQYSLRPYQHSLVQEIFSCWHSGDRRVLLQLPTAAGKTVIFSTIATEFVVKGEGVLVLVHREELLLQAKEKLEAVTGLPSGIIKAGNPANPEHLIQVASIQTLVRRMDSLPNASLIIYDEAHHSCSPSSIKILQAYPKAYLLGVTATPARCDGRGFKHLFDKLILGPTVEELIKEGYLCGFRLFAAQNAIDTKGVKTTAGDYNSKQLAKKVNTAEVRGDVIRSYREHANGKKTVVFCVDVEHSKQCAQAFLTAGVAAEHLDGETPTEERRAILSRFNSGETLVLTNCGIVSEGTDVPSIEAVQVVRPTKSLILWLQMLGRALRPHPGKKEAIIVDQTKNWIMHGLPDEEREWSLEPVSLKRKSWAVECPECRHIFTPFDQEKRLNVATCPNCETAFQFEMGEGGRPVERSERIIAQDEHARLQEIALNGDPEILEYLHALKAVQEGTGYKPGWVYYRLIEKYPVLGVAELRECAKVLGYKAGWVAHKLKEMQGVCEED